jgi:hypothetical protein
MSDHPTIILKHPKLGYETKIDKEIAPLISKLWEMNINTAFCCQGDMTEESCSYSDTEAGRAYISFSEFADFLAFMNKISFFNEIHTVETNSEVYENYPSTLFDRLYRCPLNRWEFSVNPKWIDGKQQIMTSVYFPSHDIKEATLALDPEYKATLFSVTKEPVITEVSQAAGLTDEDYELIV